MTVRKFVPPVVVMVLLVLYFSCTKDHVAPQGPIAGCDSTITYTGRVRPILETYCSQPDVGLCHDAQTAEKQIEVDTYAGAVSTFRDNNAICNIEGNCQVPMPDPAYFSVIPDSARSVPADSLNVIKCWISNGYPQ
ncbi:MAG TPA: hypothetical protein VG603_14875 [Chitinophagales bacterium]|nr:hypothetical protein [Chitinophagales bacterium]